MKRRTVRILGLLLVVIAGYLWLRPDHTAAPSLDTHTHTKKQTTPSKINDGTTKTFDKTQYSLTNPASIWVIVNKTHPLQPKSYVPQDLVLPNVTQRIPGAEEMKMRAPAAKALESLFAGAKSAGYELSVSTAYRGYAYQKGLYDGYVAHDGLAAADKTSARPGYSEHQTGLAVDIRARSNKCPLESCFGDMAEGKWLAANAYKYGFLLRYTPDKESVTGYEYEPWHFRYIGTDLSNEMHKKGITTLEEFFGVSGGTTYR